MFSITEGCNKVANIKKQFISSLKENPSEPEMDLIKQMRIIHCNGIKAQSSLLNELNDPDAHCTEDLLKLSTNESLLHVIHCNIRQCEEKAYEISKLNKPKNKSNDLSTNTNDQIIHLKPVDNKNIIVSNKNNRNMKAVINNGELSLKNITTSPQSVNTDKSDIVTKIKDFISGKNSTMDTNQTGGMNDNFSLTDYINNLQTSEANNLSNLHSEYVKNKKQLVQSNHLNQSDFWNVSDNLNASDDLNDDGERNQSHISMKNFDVAKPTVINYWADWCGYSNNFKPEWEKFVRNASTRYPNVQVTNLNVKKDKELSTLASQVGVEGYPTIVFFINGNKYKMLSGRKTMKDVNTFIDNVIETETKSS